MLHFSFANACRSFGLTAAVQILVTSMCIGTGMGAAGVFVGEQ